MQRPDLTADNLGPQGDAFYSLLMHAHDGLSEEESHALNMRLVLIMANQIGDIGALRELVEAAMLSTNER